MKRGHTLPPVIEFDALVQAAECAGETEKATARRDAQTVRRYKETAASLDEDAREFLSALIFLGTLGSRR